MLLPSGKRRGKIACSASGQCLAEAGDDPTRQAAIDPKRTCGSSISGLHRHMLKMWVFLEWSEVDLPHVDFIEQSICVRVERDAYWDAIAIQILGFYKTAA
jgi:hypothetical protein